MGIILKHIYEIKRKSKEFRWIETQDTAFIPLKNAVGMFKHWHQLMRTLNIECLYSREFAAASLWTETPQNPKFHLTRLYTMEFPLSENIYQPNESLALTFYEKIHLSKGHTWQIALAGARAPPKGF